MTGKVSAAPEAVDRSAMSVAVSPALQAMADDGASPAAIANVIAACAEGYPFRTRRMEYPEVVVTAPYGTRPNALLRDRVVLITGGTAGLGAGIARAAAREGATVAVTGRRRERAKRWPPSSPRAGPRRCSCKPTWPTWPRREPARRR